MTITITLDQALQQAVDHHRAGRLPEAEQLYRAILQVQPQHPDANHNLGVLAVGVGQAAAALPLLKVALEANPQVGQYWLSYAGALLDCQQITQAQQVLELAAQRGLSGAALQALQQRLASLMAACSPAVSLPVSSARVRQKPSSQKKTSCG